MNIWAYVYFALVAADLGFTLAKWGQPREGTFGWLTLVSLAITAAIVWLAVH